MTDQPGNDVPFQIRPVVQPDGTGTVVFEIYIKTTPEQLWAAIIDPQSRAKYSFGVAVESSWEAGAPYTAGAGGFAISEGVNVIVEPPHRLVQTFTALWSDEVKSAGQTQVTWEIRQVRDSCQLTVLHQLLPAQANGELYGGWPMILSGLKTLLETGQLLTTPGSLRYR